MNLLYHIFLLGRNRSKNTSETQAQLYIFNGYLPAALISLFACLFICLFVFNKAANFKDGLFN